MDDTEASLYVGDVAVAVSGEAGSTTTNTVAVHTLALGIDDADDLLQRHAIEDATNNPTPTVGVDGGGGEKTVDVEAPPTTNELGGTATLPDVPSTHPSASMSAVYRFYEIEPTLSLKRREESSIAKCRLCKRDGRLERKGCVRFSKSVTSNLWRHLKENHPDMYDKHAGEKKTIQMHKLVSASKRGRKKKVVVPPPPSSTSTIAVAATDENERFLDDVEEAGTSGHSDTAARKPVKRVRRVAPVNDQFFTDYALSMSATTTPGSHPLAGLHPGAEKRPINLDRVREVAAYLCVHELVPVELCASLAFRNLLTECQVSAALVDDATALASVFGKQAIVHQSKQLMEEVSDRVVAQLKTVDGVQLQVIEWAAAAPGEQEPATEIVGVFAVALDQEFNLVRRCLCAVPIDPSANAARESETVATQLERSDAFQRALKLLAPHKHVPNLVVVEPSRRSHLSPVLASNKLEVLESITSLLRDIMVSTITGASFTHPFMVGSEFSTNEDASHGSFERVFDTAHFVESITHDASGGRLAELLEAEVPSSILTELPNVLTGHTIRDILLKILHVVAHIKTSKETRRVMREIMVTECQMGAETFAQIFERGPSGIIVGIRSIYGVLALTIKMMPTLQRYFELHKDGTSDLAKLMQLASLSAYEWERVGYLSSLLKPFADAVSKLQEEKYVTSSLIIPSVYTLLEKLRPSSEGGSSSSELPEDMVALKHVAYAQLSSTFGYLFVEPADDWSSHQRSSFNWLWSATLLDPRTRPFIIKGALTQSQFWEVVKAEACEIAGMNKIKHKNSGLNDLSDHAMTLDDHEEPHGVDTATNGTHANGQEVAGGDLWDDLQANLTSCAQEELLLASSKSALELTKSNNLLEVEISFLQDEARISLKANPLDWWQSMRVKYPYVARLARYVLSVPGSPPSEENPMLRDAGLVRRLLSQMSLNDASDIVTASLNLRLEKQAQVESAPRQLWSTV